VGEKEGKEGKREGWQEGEIGGNLKEYFRFQRDWLKMALTCKIVLFVVILNRKIIYTHQLIPCI
jgi:hypothetical protein